MKRLLHGLLGTLALMPALSVSANVPVVAAEQERCANIKWSVAFLERYPKAPAACRAVETRDGQKYATFVGKVSKVGSTFVQVSMLDVADYPISLLAFEIGTGGRVTVNGKVEKVSELKLGDLLTFWVHEGDFGVSPTLADKPMRIIKPEAMPAQ
jgi:hypothetical protein